MSHSTKFGDRRGSIAAAVTIVLLLVGGVMVVKSFAGNGYAAGNYTLSVK